MYIILHNMYAVILLEVQQVLREKNLLWKIYIEADLIVNCISVMFRVSCYALL